MRHRWLLCLMPVLLIACAVARSRGDGPSTAPVERNPADAVFTAAQKLATDGNHKAAVAKYGEAIAIDPKIGSFYSNLGYARVGQKRFDDAIAAFRKAIEIDPAVFEQHGQSGTVLMERSVDDRGQFFFYLAKSFAQAGDAEHCANYLRKSRDEGYKLVAAAKTDPAFATVRENPLVKDILDSLTPAVKPPSSL